MKTEDKDYVEALLQDILSDAEAVLAKLRSENLVPHVQNIEKSAGLIREIILKDE